MKIEKIIKLNVELDDAECMALDEAIRVLQRVQETMEKYNCDTLMCCDEYTYDITNLKTIIGDLEMFENISEIIG